MTFNANPLAREFMEWQAALRLHTMIERNGAPHVGVAPLVTVKRPGFALDVVSHSIICGLLPEPGRLDEKTKEFRGIYEEHHAEGARAVYDQGISYLLGYYCDASAFDDTSLTTLLAKDLDLVTALRAEPRCSLVFYVFDLEARADDVSRFRCMQVDVLADVLSEGPVYENVWWHNTLFHGFADEHVVVHFHHQTTYFTGFGRLERVNG